jgi:molybdopterin-binding protein
MLSRPCSAWWLSALIPVVLGYGLAGCGDSGEAAEPVPAPTSSLSAEPISPPPTPPSSTASPSPSVQVIEVHIVDGEVHTDADRVEMTSGAAIRLIVTSDAADELHVHGADATAALVAGIPTTLDFTISEPGVFEVETHDSGLLLVQLLVR